MTIQNYDDKFKEVRVTVVQKIRYFQILLGQVEKYLDFLTNNNLINKSEVKSAKGLKKSLSKEIEDLKTFMDWLTLVLQSGENQNLGMDTQKKLDFNDKIEEELK